MGFEEKLRAAVAAEKLVPLIDWPGIRLAWLSAVHRLYAEVECWMTRGKAPIGGRVQRASVTLFEYPVGYYECPALDLEVKGRLIHFQPVATLVVGAYGRIDVYPEPRQSARSAMLVLTGSRENPEWEVWLTRDPQHRLPFGKEALEVLVESWLDA